MNYTGYFILVTSENDAYFQQNKDWQIINAICNESSFISQHSLYNNPEKYAKVVKLLIRL